MCIKSTVGSGGLNRSLAVMIVQVLLNENIARLIPLRPLIVDGKCGPVMIAAIKEFERRVVAMKEPTGLVAPGTQTYRELVRGAAPILTPDKLRIIAQGAPMPRVMLYYNLLLAYMQKYEITTALRMAHFLAQIVHESDNLKTAEEYADGSAYEGRKNLGNTHPGDGKKFKGRGLIQLTGRSNYQAYGDARNRDFVTPENYLQIATDPSLAVDVSCWFWSEHHLNRAADADSLKAVTLAINPGEVHSKNSKVMARYQDRVWHLELAKTMLGIY